MTTTLLHYSCRPRQALFVALVLAALPLTSIAQSVVRGPYLQSATPDSIIVQWRTDSATDSVVGFATADGTPATVSNGAAVVDHAVTLSGLSADTLYNYTIGNVAGVLAGGDLGTNGDGEHFFRTSPVAGTDKDTRIWIIGDSGTKDANAAAVRNAYKGFTGARGTDVWLMLGDNAYSSGRDSQYQAAVFDMYPQLLRQVPLWSALGNHDGTDVVFNPPGAYMNIFTFPTGGEAGGAPSGTENYYSFDYGNIHFITLDSSINANRTAGSAMYTWLAADLAANTQDWTIAFWHHPHYSKGSHDSDVEIALIEMRENAMPLLEANGVDLVLSGHSHSYERSYLLDSHYDASATLTPAMILDGGDGAEFGDGAYLKPGPAGTANEGAVHAVIGSSGKLEDDGPLNHPVMHVSTLTLGSLVVDVSGNRLDAAFVDSTGAIQDEFTILKSPPPVVAIDVQPWDTSNMLKPASDNPVSVAILGMSTSAGDAFDFDASQVDPASVRFGLGGANNISTPWASDIDGDSQGDILLAFSTQDSAVLCGDTEISLTGATLTGEAFTGTDSIQTDDCESLSCHP